MLRHWVGLSSSFIHSFMSDDIKWSCWKLISEETISNVYQFPGIAQICSIYQIFHFDPFLMHQKCIRTFGGFHFMRHWLNCEVFHDTFYFGSHQLCSTGPKTRFFIRILSGQWKSSNWFYLSGTEFFFLGIWTVCKWFFPLFYH